MSSCSSRALTILSTVFGACGLLLVGVAVSTDYWLIMVEGIILQQNQSMEVKMALHSGLWRVCFVAGSENGRCVASEYFTEPEIEITTENTANILKMVRTATPFPMVSLLFVFTAFIISNIGHIRPQRTILAFVSGIFFILSGCRSFISLSVHEAICRGRDVPPPPCHLPPPSVRGQRLQRPVPPPRILLASTQERPQHLGGVQRHLHPAQPDSTGAAEMHPPSWRPGEPALHVFFCRELPDAATAHWLPLHTHPTQVPLLPPSGPGSSHDHASIACPPPSLSHTCAHERLPLLRRGSHTETSH
ncbi:voltage-dependent calcium channel gamma-7 subunit isoform X2 [Gambusia affinis]|uniref:voltage-dependent calcium channel gamma-7 subunit isoform X2 n=1 Tax=Gambusia affinis TaxID=33528 RepID=UPI001CDC4795|nr:voltage-dependent calcium channel gamma-7 subunit isoform X2 [Gambusia affinis]